jgi:hypothetical protein
MVNAKECRESAARCVELGNEAATVETQNLYFEMARSWTELAEELERGAGFETQFREVSIHPN